MGPTIYEILVRGHVGGSRSAWFDGLSLTNLPDGTTLMIGELADQAALFGILDRIRDFGLPLLRVTARETDTK